jgi:hypothetical protein
VFDFAQQERKGRERDPWSDPNTKGVWVFDFAQQERKGRERADIPCRPAKRPTKNWQGRRHSPVVAAWEEGGRASESERAREEEEEEEERKGVFRADVLCWAHPVLG